MLLLQSTGDYFRPDPIICLDWLMSSSRSHHELSSIQCRYYVDTSKKISTNFHVVSTYFFYVILIGKKSLPFRRNFDGQKIHAVSTYFIRHNIDERKIDVVSMYFLQCNFDGKKIDVISMYFFQNNFDWRKVKVFSMYFDAILMMFLKEKNLVIILVSLFDNFWIY